MDNISKNGNLEIVKYLHSMGKNCTTKAIDNASFNGHLEVVKYLHSIGKIVQLTQWTLQVKMDI